MTTLMRKPKKLTKFPVTMPDGTEYRVKITHDFDGDYIVRVYANNRRLRFLPIYKNVIVAGLVEGYVTAAEYCVRRYHDRHAEKQRRLHEFNEWDGTIPESTSEGDTE